MSESASTAVPTAATWSRRRWPLNPEVFNAGINVFGVTDSGAHPEIHTRVVGRLPQQASSLKSAIPLPTRSACAVSHRCSTPITSVARFWWSGTDDPRVLPVESDELVARVREDGRTTEYVLFDDEGHGFRKRENRIIASEAYLRFLNTYLKGNGASVLAI